MISVPTWQGSANCPIAASFSLYEKVTSSNVRASGCDGILVKPFEPQQLVGRVKELLARPEPPSIGVACFNLSQRDAITEVLEELAAADADFAAKLAAARVRRGEGSFEGLFVKNLENVQGDERDTMIFSIGYGPDEARKFTLNFGPLNRPGGERRLNVAVTRARERVEVVSSVRASDFPIGSTSPGVRLLEVHGRAGLC